jgi:putative ABC transport system substrate-binding protein
MISRREIIAAAFLGAVAVWPAAVRAQQPERMRRIGVMVVNAESDPEGQLRVAAFRRDLQELGWIEGHNVRIDYRWRAGEPDRARAYAAELVASAPDVILANGTAALTALQQATSTIPIVFVVVVDPVGAGYVRSLAEPGGNITGFSTFDPEIGGKWLQLLKEIAPGLRGVATISDPAFRGFAALSRAIESMAPGLGLQPTSVVFHRPDDDIEGAVAQFAREPGGGLIVMPTGINNTHRDRIFALAARYRLPAVYPFRLYATGGGLMAYGFDPTDLFRRGASYVDRILKGESPAKLPVQAPTKFELIVNLKAAKGLGIEIPRSILVRADEVIE